MIRSIIRQLLFLLGAFFLRAYLLTLRVRVLQTHKSDESCVYAIWHDSLLIIPRILDCLIKNKQELHIMISKSRDGDFASFFAAQFPFIKIIRVAHTSRAMALRKAIKVVEQGSSLLITPDGPRGPRRKIKEGILAIARASNRSITSISVKYHWKIELSSWDKFQIPFPFSRVDVQFCSRNSLSEREAVTSNIESDLTFRKL